MSLEPGTSLGTYEILAPLGAGGMGEVYRAKDTKLGREVAIKVLPEGFADEPDRMARFEREAKVLASLNDHNIATLYGYEADGDTQFLVMELVEGETLAERIARGPVPIDEAVALFLQIAAGLESAHEKGVIHRDLKPANVKIAPGTEGPVVKILDFGLAKAMAPEPLSGAGSGGSESQSLSPTLTMAATMRGEILGTAAYMAPEQARGLEVDKRADVWSFGVCLYEALTGTRSFKGRDATDTLAAVLRDDLDWEALPSSTPPAILRLLQRCLQREPHERLRDIGDAALELRASMEEEPDPAGTSEVESVGPARRWGVFAAIALVVALVAATVAWIVKPVPSVPAPPVVRFALAPGLLTGLDGVVISRDGRKIAAPLRDGEGTRIHYRLLEQQGWNPIRGTEDAETPFFSPDGEWVAFFAGGGIKKVALAGGPAMTVVPEILTGVRQGASWSSRDEIVFAHTSSPELFLVDAAGGEPRALPIEKSGEASLGLQWPSFMPSGRAVLFTLQPAGLESAEIGIHHIESGETLWLLPGTYPRWASSGHLVFAREGSIWAVAMDPETFSLLGEARPFIEGVQVNSGGLANYDIAVDGSLFYLSSASYSGRAFAVTDASGSSASVQLTTVIVNPRLSPDGTQVAGTDLDSSPPALVVYDLERAVLSTLTFDGTSVAPVWSPDGRQIAFGTVPGQGGGGLWIRPADGSGQPELLVSGDQLRFPSDWSPDGESLVFAEVDPIRRGDIWILPLSGDQEPMRFLSTDANEQGGRISPDGRWLAYQSDKTGTFEVYVRPFPVAEAGGLWQISSGGGQEPLWAPDGTRLYFRAAGQVLAVDVVSGSSFSVGRQTVLFEEGGRFEVQTLGPTWDLFPGGERFLMIDSLQSRAGVDPFHVVLNWTAELERVLPVD